MSRAKNEGKPNLSKVSPSLKREMAEIFDYGDTKYGHMNWKDYEDPNEIVSALERHLDAWKTGEFTDKETGNSHLAHICCNAQILHYWEKNDLEKLKKLYWNSENILNKSCEEKNEKRILDKSSEFFLNGMYDTQHPTAYDKFIHCLKNNLPLYYHIEIKDGNNFSIQHDGRGKNLKFDILPTIYSGVIITSKEIDGFKDHVFNNHKFQDFKEDFKINFVEKLEKYFENK